jgi:hypothetical protein
MTKIKNPEDFVPKFYRMDNRVEDMIPTGRFLQEGMKVTYATSNVRLRIEDVVTDWQLDRALSMNRWFTVTDLQITGVYANFTAVFDDGTKEVKNEYLNTPWYVKRDSIKDPEDVKLKNSVRYTQIYDIVRSALNEQSRNNNPTGVDMALIDRVTKEILKVV